MLKAGGAWRTVDALEFAVEHLIKWLLEVVVDGSEK